jgi:N-acylneuraminate cytidylyltransferase/CMP-N,N'-diacetyllegionaminic acid synthase
MSLLSKPLVAWSIEQALGSEYLDEVVVSTDSDKIARISERYGAKVPFLRPAKLSGDDARSIDVILHALDFFRKNGKEFDYLCLLEPTSPLRETRDIDICISRLIDNGKARSIVSVAPLESAHPEFNVVINDNTGFIIKATGGTGFNVLRRQDLQKVYFFDGTIYISEVKSLADLRTFYHKRTLPYIVPRWKSLEIDEISDMVCAKALLKARKKKLF